MIVHFPGKCKALSSIPGTAKVGEKKGWGSSSEGECLPSLGKVLGSIPSTTNRQLKSYQTVFQSSCTILYSGKQCVRISVPSILISISYHLF
jgi:hypothetical protein